MVNQVRTLDFLPEIFRTETNSQFFAATLDVLTSQPDLNRVQGFIGRTYGYGVDPQDKYVIEPTDTRTDYQLEPSVVFLKSETQSAQDFINYPGIVQSIKNQGGITDNHDRLFKNEFYSWDSFTDLDKIVNYSEYYWIPNGPDPVRVSVNDVFLKKEYTVVDNDNGFEFQDISTTNPSITLLRGGTYSFNVNQKTKFWIQGVPGLTGLGLNGIDTRQILGVTNNGAEIGQVIFNVPLKDAQQQYDLPGNNLVDVVSTLDFDQINGKTTSQVGNIDGVTQLNNRTLLFFNNGDPSTQTNFYNISVDPITKIITLNSGDPIPDGEKITVVTGVNYLGRNFYRDPAGLIQEIPYLSSTLDQLYYQDGADVNSVGVINLIDSSSDNVIRIEDILGKKNYVSPNGVTFINGLKVQFDSNVVPSSYVDKQYYVEGVGTGINLLPVNEYLAVESKGEGLYVPWQSVPWDESVWDQVLFVPITPDYITINRNSRDRNAWSRSNRWFNAQVINATIAYNGRAFTEESNEPIRAQRPIIEFQPDLGLYNSGTVFAGFVDLFDSVTTDAFNQVVGQSSYIVDGIPLASGQRIIFSNDSNQQVRKTIYTVNFVPAGGANSLVISLDPVVVSGTVQNGQIYVVYGNSYASTGWRYLGTDWQITQEKNQVNQPPLFDIFDVNDNSISDNFYYPASTFQGTKLFSYTPGTGQSDPVLGFPISYSSGTAIGDINFTVNFNTDTFKYNQGTTVITDNISVGFVPYYPTSQTPELLTGWVTAAAQSIQYQVFENPVLTSAQKIFVCDVPADLSSEWRSVVVYLDDAILDDTAYIIVVDSKSSTTTVTLNDEALPGNKVTVLIFSNSVSKTAYYQIPSNLENNPFNTNISQVTVGDLKNQYQTIFSNAPGTTGKTFGTNNVYNLGNLTRYGTAIIQNSASLVLPGAFLRKPELNVFESIQYNSDEYSNYKTLLVDITNQNDFSIYQSPASLLDTVIYQISSTKNSTNSFFWSDMLFSGSPYRVNNYNFETSLTSASFPLGRIYDFTSANYYGLGIYLTRTVNSVQRVIQLIKGTDYVVNTISPTVTVNYAILPGDVITVKEYNQTYGSYCPNTPTKLGLFPASIPAVITDNTYTTPTNFILGHDGSYNKLYGTYVNGQLNDLRDIVLLEFEKRIYNNLKVTGDIPLTADSIIPGQFRTTDYTRNQILEIYSSSFLRWVGKNRIDYKTQVFNTANRYTYNYNQSSNKLDNSLIYQGYWRGIYQWLYDTSNPANAPWEMLGLVNKPGWWDNHYGTAPYTSGNTLMWQDISRGYVWNNGNPYINPAKVRPKLLEILPVNSVGNLVDPLQVIVGNYNALTFNKNWIVGDQAPVETSYLRSSSWPFDLMRLLAVTAPAKFFNLFVDRDRYKYNTQFNQYLYDNRYHLNPKNVQIYGDGTAKHSYINWVVDYINQRGMNGTETVTDILKNLDVRLTYSLAGFSAKNYLKFLIEKSTVNTQNSSLLIPDDSYSILLYDDVPADRINYSSVVVQKTAEGYTIWGNSQEKPYFTVAVPKPGPVNKIIVNETSVNLSKEYYDNKTATVPYGTVFYSLQGVSEFLNSYGKFLTDQGMVFEYVENTVAYDWVQIVREFLYWGQQYWEVGSIISLNPSSQLLSVNREGLVVRPLTLQKENFILNQNLIPIQNQNSCVHRENTSFTVKVLSPGDSLAYTNLNLSSMEHAIVFDNYTVFNDTIYNLTTGLRQTRLLMQGYKSGEWNGYVNASGFILNENNIQEWRPNAKYPKGQIVTYKNKYWAANRLVQPKSEFDEETGDWIETEYGEIKTGLLPNPSTMAYESLYYYDSYVANLENDADLLSFSLIGYRPRQYLADADLSDITQVNVYKNIVTEKGTNLLANAFKKADLIQGQIDYDVRENWAIKNSNFGSVLNNNFVECLLNQNLLTGNPTILSFSESGTVTGAQETVLIKDLINFERPPVNANFLPLYDNIYVNERGLPSAGYVNLNDVKFRTYELFDLNGNINNIDTLYRGDNIWVADYRGSWSVFTPQSINTQASVITNNLNGTISIQFNEPHGLLKDDVFVLFNFNVDVNRYYTVLSVDSLTKLTVANTLPADQIRLTGTGLVFKLISRRFYQASDQVNNYVVNSEFYSKLSWIDNDNDQWAVYKNSPVYKKYYQFTPTVGLGAAVASSSAVGYLAGDGDTGTIYRWVNSELSQTITVANSTVGSHLLVVDDWLFAPDTRNNKILVYTLAGGDLSQSSTLTINGIANTGAISVSKDKQWLYVANSVTKTVSVYLLNSQTNSYVFVNQIQGNTQGFGNDIATSIDGAKLIVAADLATVDSLVNVGQVSVYSRSVENFSVTVANTTVFNTTQPIPSGLAQVYVNDVLISSAVVTASGQVTLPTAPAVGSVVTISYGRMTLLQTMTSSAPRTNGLFGKSVDTNRYGAEILIGAPFDLISVSNTPNVEGSVYRWTNSGQRYGMVTGRVIGEQVGTVYINGYPVFFNGDIAAIVSQINQQTTNAVVASFSGDQLTIIFDEPSLGIINNVLDITGTIESLSALGITLYTNTQVINSINLSDTGQFGWQVAMNERDSVIISAITATEYSETTFDYSDDFDDNDTIFDNGATIFVDGYANAGAVYEYVCLPSAQESINNPSKYVFGQYVQTTDRVGVALQPRYGYSLSYSDQAMMVGSPNWYSNGMGRCEVFTTSTQSTSWSVDKTPLPMVSVNKLNNISIYNTVNNTSLEFLDYIDPVQGKMLGSVETNIDYVSPVDPAQYGTGIEWTVQSVGKMWLDTTSVKIMNYNQPDIAYNASYWGVAFPGSTADIYTWVESSLPPTQYPGPGFPARLDLYNSALEIDDSTDSIVTMYYFWVKNYDLVPPGKTISPINLSQYILNPINSGIAFLAGITTNTVAMYNCADYIQANTSALHLGYRVGDTLDQLHQQWTLIKTNDASDFLSGLPNVLDENPSGLYLKYLDSFSGEDAQGLTVPDARLPELTRYGVDFRPRQSMFKDRQLAVENAITYANQILIKLPITEIRSLYFLNKTGSGYDTRNFWTYADWWAEGYSSDTKIVLEVDTVTDLQRLVSDQIIYETLTTSLVLDDGVVVRVSMNRNGNSETWVWYKATGWQRIGLTNGTVQIKTQLYTNEYGWDTEFFGSNPFDNSNARETYWIMRWLNEQVYIDDLEIERNNTLMLMFNFIQSEASEDQNYLTWLNKTSLIDVSHRVRELLPYKKFQRDNQEFLEGYLNEIKPYHVKIKDFLFTYDGQDEYPGNLTDFDLPAQYNSNTGLFETPRLVYQPTYETSEYTPDSEIWKEPDYSQWFNNYGLSITASDIGVTAVTTLSSYVTVTDLIIPVSDSYSLPETGMVFMGNEQISYDGIDRINNLLLGVNRGINTAITAHKPGTDILINMPAVAVLDQGRSYTAPPVITAYIDTDKYPAPRTPAVLNAVMAADKLLSVTVENPGSGYAVTPEIRIESSITVSFDSLSVNLFDNTITLYNHPFITGDSVVYRRGIDTVAPLGLTNNGYYYIRKIDNDTVALYESAVTAFNLEKTTLTDSDRVKLISVGTGVNNSLAVTARAVAFTSSQPIRELKTTIKFDRISYGSLVTDWNPNTFYAGEFTDPANLSSSSLLADSTRPWDYTGYDSEEWSDELKASAQGALFNIISAPTSNYPDTVVVQLNYGRTRVSPGQLMGQRLSFYKSSGWDSVNNTWDSNYWDYSSWYNKTEYYAKVISETGVELYYDPLFNNPVKLSDFDYSTNDPVLLPEPFTFNQSLVKYAGKLWQCVVSNNDTVFDYSKWQQILSDNQILNAADRIMAFYEPTINMTGRELRQLMTGITYPNATVQGLEFNAGGEWDSVPWDDVNWNQDPNPDELLDTSLISPPFVYDPITNPTVYDVQGGEFTDGYGPEELVPGLLTDQLNFSVTTDGLDPGQYLNFRISVSKSGQSKVYNTNPYTQTVLSRTFVSTGSISDVIHVTDVTKLVELKDYLVTTDASGVAIVQGVIANKVTAISINSIEKFTWAPENTDTIIIKIEGITVPTDVTVTIAQGNLILLENEYIGFTSVNVTDNTVTGLQRGLMGTVTNSQVAAGTTVQSVLERDMLPQIYYDDWWYGQSVGGWGREPWSREPGWSGSTEFFDGTLYQSTYAPAVFLKKTTAT